uniref:Uncharacterized protein n=1 Tax=Physcomitrium patens TaxID=3218 RepID=A0A2K1JPC1_PHYPA|nr:hypothetical protein PHYPA_015758 [Physcomitrium patens]
MYTDLSILDIRVIFIQTNDEGKEFVVAYASRSINIVKVLYSLYEYDLNVITFEYNPI